MASKSPKKSKSTNTKRSKKNEPRTKRAIVHLLKQSGAMDAHAIAEQLSISAMAVRQHLYALQDEALVAYQEEARPMGRPAKLWHLTAAADRFFPEGYAELTLSLIQSVSEAFGEEGLNRLLDIRTREQLDAYRSQMKEQNSLQAQLETLADIRTTEGYMADVLPQADGSILLVENHCPICAAAEACTGLCSRELEVFQAVLGEHVDIERTEHILEGSRRCAYRVTSVQFNGSGD
ncbi:transcriptional regulator [Oscillatoria sp. CS-180]|uniref:helix-turn-helix transcriptional regulator n=1 Tax=Oscillatoria sp. CS-180 TaxID=3021720 RepID=UPI00232DA884|nr:metalloregulator ArsR/SmtB family transcription factor [Oscillatoria sp. CS-180]MDB9525119.1 transcriptional regulator [Oscillatoria sp. CS-180]